MNKSGRKPKEKKRESILFLKQRKEISPDICSKKFGFRFEFDTRHARSAWRGLRDYPIIFDLGGGDSAQHGAWASGGTGIEMGYTGRRDERKMNGVYRERRQEKGRVYEMHQDVSMSVCKADDNDRASRVLPPMHQC